MINLLSGGGPKPSDEPTEDDYKITETEPKSKILGVPGGFDSDFIST